MEGRGRLPPRLAAPEGDDVAGQGRALVALTLLAHHEGVPPRHDDGRFGRLAGSIANAVLAGVDPDVIAERLDLDGLVARLDIDALVDRIDPQAIVDRVDPQGIVDRVDPNTITDRVDVDRLLDRVDVNRLLDRVDVDRFLDRVDVDRLLERADLEEVVRRAGIPEIVAESTGQVAGSALDVVRKQVVALDVLLTRALLRLTGRDVSELPAGPPRLVGETMGDAPILGEAGEDPHGDVSGHYAGLLTQAGSHAADLGLASVGYTATLTGLAAASNAVLGTDLSGEVGGIWWLLGYLTVLFFYFWLPVAIVGRTLAMGIIGLRIVARDGSTLRESTVLWRTLLLPLTTLPFGAGFLVILFDRERRSLHDRLARTAVVYDWGSRTARMPSPLGDFLNRAR